MLISADLIVILLITALVYRKYSDHAGIFAQELKI